MGNVQKLTPKEKKIGYDDRERVCQSPKFKNSQFIVDIFLSTLHVLPCLFLRTTQ